MTRAFIKSNISLVFCKITTELFNLSKQLDNIIFIIIITNLVQRITNKCLILLSLLCIKVAIAIKEKTLKQKMVRSKCPNNFPKQVPNFDKFY